MVQQIYNASTWDIGVGGAETMSPQLHTKFETHPSYMTLSQINKYLHRTLVPEYIWYFAGTKII